MVRDRGLAEEDIVELQEIHRRNRDTKVYNIPHRADKECESVCPECGRHVTETSSFGEVGHEMDCSIRDERYRGQAGSMQPSPPNAKADAELVADGGER